MSGLPCDALLFVATNVEQEELRKAALDLGCDWKKDQSERGEFWKQNEAQWSGTKPPPPAT